MSYLAYCITVLGSRITILTLWSTAFRTPSTEAPQSLVPNHQTHGYRRDSKISWRKSIDLWYIARVSHRWSEIPSATKYQADPIKDVQDYKNDHGKCSDGFYTVLEYRKMKLLILLELERYWNTLREGSKSIGEGSWWWFLLSHNGVDPLHGCWSCCRLYEAFFSFNWRIW